MNKRKREELRRCLSGITCDKSECKQLRDYWGYQLGYEYTVKSADKSDYIFTIINDKPKQYGW